MNRLEQHTIALPPQLAGRLKQELGRAGTGIDEAAFLQQLHYWQTNEKSQGWLVDGFKWVYNSLNDWLGQFPWMSEYGLRKAIANLKKLNLIEAVQHRLGEFKRVMFYRIRYEVLAENFSCDLAPRCVSSDRDDMPIVHESLTNSTSKITNIDPEGDRVAQEGGDRAALEPNPEPVSDEKLEKPPVKTASPIKLKAVAVDRSSPVRAEDETFEKLALTLTQSNYMRWVNGGRSIALLNSLLSTQDAIRR